jgi:hypothetical protein
MSDQIDEASDPLMRELGRRVKTSHGDTTVEQIVLKYGVPFKGIDRPAGMRLGPKKNCFRNSYYAASKRDGLLYVEGFAMVKGGWLFHHAWVSADGVHAVDVTLRYAPSSIHLVGIPFPIGLATEEIVESGGLLPLFDAQKSRARMEELTIKRRIPGLTSSVEDGLRRLGRIS